MAETQLMETAGVSLQQHSGATAAAQHAMAQVQARSLVALGRPRDLDVARAKILADCKRPRFAQAAWYEIQNRGSGLTIRFAESILRNWGNLYCEAITVDDNRDAVTVRVSVTDLESNACNTRDVTVAKTVERKKPPKNEAAILDTRYNTYGDTLYILRATSDDVLGKVNSQISKALRTLLIKFVPFDVIEECQDMVLATMKNRAAEDPDTEKKRVVDGFAAIGVTPHDLTDFLGKSLARLQPADLVKLRGVYTAMRDGETTWEDVMEAAKPPQTAEGVTNAMDEDPPPADGAPDEPDPIADLAAEEPKSTPRSRKKSVIIEDIEALGKTDNQVADEASDMMGQTVLDIGVLSAKQLETLLERLGG